MLLFTEVPRETVRKVPEVSTTQPYGLSKQLISDHFGLRIPAKATLRASIAPFSDSLSETVRKASSANQTPRHQTAHRYVDERFASLRQALVVFAHPSVVVYPGERPLHYPPTW